VCVCAFYYYYVVIGDVGCIVGVGAVGVDSIAVIW